MKTQKITGDFYFSHNAASHGDTPLHKKAWVVFCDCVGVKISIALVNRDREVCMGQTGREGQGGSSIAVLRTTGYSKLGFGLNAGLSKKIVHSTRKIIIMSLFKTVHFCNSEARASRERDKRSRECNAIYDDAQRESSALCDEKAIRCAYERNVPTCAIFFHFRHD